MDYFNAMNYIEEKNKLGTVPGLDNVKELLTRLGNPQNKCRCLHIAGTNGKGSIFAFVQEALIDAGYKVGRYISPTIFEYRERFQINKNYISEESFAALLTRVSVHVDEMIAEGMASPTAFEIETAIAFLYFYEEQVDFALIECGMGGLLDGTNVIDKPFLTVMASISMDHMQFLGSTLRDIATNKAGIIKSFGKCISYPQCEEVSDVLYNKCKVENAILTFADPKQLEILSMDVSGTTFIYKGERYKISLLGEHQVYNAITALEVLEDIAKDESFALVNTHIKNGLKKTDWQGRMTKINDEPLMFVDGAHNEAAWIFLRNTVNKYFTNRRIIYIIGVLKDKEYNRMVDILKDTMTYAIAITPDTPRGLDKEVLADVLSRNNVKCSTAGSAKSAIWEAKKLAGKEDVIMICGSLSFISDYLKYDEENS